MATYPVVSRGIGRKPPSQIIIDGSSARVSLTQGFDAIIDSQDVPLVAGYRWVILSNSKTGHAYAARYEAGKCFLMHRVILGATAGTFVDHADGDGLNNRRSNIRLATHAQNMVNRIKDRRNKLGIRGVSKEKGKYRAKITPGGKTVHLGTYKTPEEAAAAYRGACIAIWGEFAPPD